MKPSGRGMGSALSSSWIAMRCLLKQVAPLFKLSCCLSLLGLSTTLSGASSVTTAYLHEMQLSGTFGETTFGSEADASYPFDSLRGGTFRGSFIYDSMPTVDASQGGFPYVSASISIFDRSGLLLNTITTTPNKYNLDEQRLVLTFGPSAGIYNGIEDLRLIFNGSFTFDYPAASSGVTTAVAPLPEQLVNSTLFVGFLETDSAPFEGWDLPVISAQLTHIGSTPYLQPTHEVPDTSSTLAILCPTVLALLIQRRLQRS
jgi:hypothetical protein